VGVQRRSCLESGRLLADAEECSQLSCVRRKTKNKSRKGLKMEEEHEKVLEKNRRLYLG